MEWPRGKKESACSKNRKKADVVGAQQIGAKGTWIEVEVVGPDHTRPFKSVNVSGYYPEYNGKQSYNVA